MRATLRRFLKYVCVLSLLLACDAFAVRTETPPRNYTFVVGSGFVCDSGDTSICPALARSAEGDWFEVSGAGMFGRGDKTAKAFGTFSHRAANGTLLEMGVWTVDSLVSFESYGLAPTALMKWGQAAGRPQFGPRRFKGSSAQIPSGGLAVFRIVLMPVSGATKSAALRVNCPLGVVPTDRSVGGIRITLEDGGLEYTEEPDGRVMFLVAMPETKSLTPTIDHAPTT
jgi:hypothetical protein